MTHLMKETRLGVRRSVLSELRSLSESTPRAWTPANLISLIEFTGLSTTAELTKKALNILSTLVASQEFHLTDVDVISRLKFVSEKYMWGLDTGLAVYGVQLYCNLALLHKESDCVSEALECSLHLIQVIIA